MGNSARPSEKEKEEAEKLGLSVNPNDTDPALFG